MAVDPFLKSEKSFAAISALVDAHGLILYCGAGVTRDRTGVGWRELVQELHDRVSRGRGVTITRSQAAAIREVIARVPAKQAASIVFEAFHGPDSENAFLSRHLRRILYRAFGWAEGLILRNVALLAVEVGSVNQPVTIVTTNYDTYIEERILATLDEFLDGETPLPGLRRFASGPEPIAVVRQPTNGCTSYIDVYFPHGRVPETGPVEGDLVFTENSYSRHSLRTVRLLTNLFARSEGLLMVGAGIEDDPLIEALTITKGNGAPHVALLDLPATSAQVASVEGREAASEALGLRGRHLGTELLFPASHAQVAQFVDELRIAKVMHLVGHGNSYRAEASYPVRLQSWWENWRQTESPELAMRHFDLLSDGLRQLERSSRTQTFLTSARRSAWRCGSVATRRRAATAQSLLSPHPPAPCSSPGLNVPSVSIIPR